VVMVRMDFMVVHSFPLHWPESSPDRIRSSTVNSKNRLWMGRDHNLLYHVHAGSLWDNLKSTPVQ
jgi:hypothetical protein